MIKKQLPRPGRKLSFAEALIRTNKKHRKALKKLAK